MVTLHPMTNDSLELIAAARRGAEKAWRDGYAYTKAGIMLDDLLSEDERPRTLFEETDGGTRRDQWQVWNVDCGDGVAGVQARMEDAVRDAVAGVDDRHRAGADGSGLVAFPSRSRPRHWWINDVNSDTLYRSGPGAGANGGGL